MRFHREFSGPANGWDRQDRALRGFVGTIAQSEVARIVPTGRFVDVDGCPVFLLLPGQTLVQREKGCESGPLGQAVINAIRVAGRIVGPDGSDSSGSAPAIRGLRCPRRRMPQTSVARIASAATRADGAASLRMSADLGHGVRAARRASGRSSTARKHVTTTRCVRW